MIEDGKVTSWLVDTGLVPRTKVVTALRSICGYANAGRSSQEGQETGEEEVRGTQAKRGTAVLVLKDCNKECIRPFPAGQGRGTR